MIKLYEHGHAGLSSQSLAEHGIDTVSSWRNADVAIVAPQSVSDINEACVMIGRLESAGVPVVLMWGGDLPVGDVIEWRHGHRRGLPALLAKVARVAQVDGKAPSARQEAPGTSTLPGQGRVPSSAAGAAPGASNGRGWDARTAARWATAPAGVLTPAGARWMITEHPTLAKEALRRCATYLYLRVKDSVPNEWIAELDAIHLAPDSDVNGGLAAAGHGGISSDEIERTVLDDSVRIKARAVVNSRITDAEIAAYAARQGR